MNWKTLLIGAALVIGMTFLVLEIRREFPEWNVDFSNAAWGAITAALISSVIGVLLKFATDAKLAALQGHVQRDLTTLKATLDDRNSATSARRDYEYEARKRLYDQVEPLLFQVYEAVDEAHHRVRSLTRTARNGELSWLEKNGYYLSSTVYKLLLPVALLRLIQQRMTLVDLGLDPQIELRYLLLKQYARSFTDDFIFAQTPPKLPYDPNHADWPKKRNDEPAVYARQALVLGDLECVADLLIIKEGEKSRVISYGEFEGVLKMSPIDDNLQEAIDLFRGFSPDRRPVLARMLVALGCLSRFIVATFHAGHAGSSLRGQYNAIVDDALAKEVSWGPDHDDGVKIAADYWGRRLDLLSEEISARRADNKTPQRS